MAKNTTQAQAETPRAPTFDLNDPTLQAIIAQAVAAAVAKRDAQQASSAKADSSAKMEALTLKAFRKAGFEDIKPRENVLTYGKWIEAGRKVKEGEKSVKVKNLRLFHISQTEPITAKEKAAILAAKAAKATPAKPASTQAAPTAKPAKGHQPQAAA